MIGIFFAQNAEKDKLEQDLYFWGKKKPLKKS